MKLAWPFPWMPPVLWASTSKSLPVMTNHEAWLLRKFESDPRFFHWYQKLHLDENDAVCVVRIEPKFNVWDELDIGRMRKYRDARYIKRTLRWPCKSTFASTRSQVIFLAVYS
jgi:hypothetical protein